MLFQKNFKFINCIGHHSLLYGETDTRKTYFTAKFVQFLLQDKNYEPNRITILDFAPKLSFYNNIKIGGKIEDYYENCKKCNFINLKGEIIPPRLEAKNKTELYENICHNYKLTSKAIQDFEKKPNPVLIVNDISIYLHLGDVNYLLEIIDKADTFFGNTYYGSKIKRKFARLLSIREMKKVEFLIKKIKNSFFTG
ncbi:MAG: hypothetical protein ACFE85_17340 [Candidatus Hodarchaeota archaeon]